MTSVPDVLPSLTTAEYKEIYAVLLARYTGREKTHECMLKCLSEVKAINENGLHVLVVGPGSGDVELDLIKNYRIAHLTAVEPSYDMANALEANLQSSSTFIATFNIHRTTIEAYLMDKNNTNQQFDIILMMHSMYYPSSRSSVLRQLRSLLRPTTGRLIIVHVCDNWAKPSLIYAPYSSQTVSASDIERDLHDVNIPFERYIEYTKLDLTDVKGNEKLEWAIASFCLGVNAISDNKNVASDVIALLVSMSQTTKDGRLILLLGETVIVVKPAN